jgi:hypothetical protein
MSEPQSRSQVPSEGGYVLPPRRRRPRIAALRRRLARMPKAAGLYRATFQLRRELGAVYHDVRARFASRREPSREHERFARQSVPCLRVAPATLDALLPSDAAARGDAVQVRVARAATLVPLLGDRFALYPPDATVRFVPWSSVPASDVVEPAREALLAGNVLHSRGGGPRPYDALELHAGDDRYLLLVADARSAEEFVPAGVSSILAAGEVRRLAEPLHANDADAALAWEQFRVPDPAALVRHQLDEDAQRAFHFGREIALKGGRYLYQSVPSVGATGRRDSSRRWRLILSLLEDAGVDLSDRLVCDVGCNAGMMLGAALADRACWGLGWDLPPVVARGRELLLSLGFSRFELVGAEMDANYRLLDDVPEHLRPRLNGSLVLYLAIRHHIGFLRQLGEFPWRALVYEGGELEGVDRFGESLAGLCELCDFEVAAAVDFRDGEGRARPVAILVRR